MTTKFELTKFQKLMGKLDSAIRDDENLGCQRPEDQEEIHQTYLDAFQEVEDYVNSTLPIWRDITKEQPPFDPEGYRDSYRLPVLINGRTAIEVAYFGPKLGFYLDEDPISNVTHWMVYPKLEQMK